ncbi:MAG: ABC transporter ATP-binding protein [Thermodesulfobacteriota bacterium]
MTPQLLLSIQDLKTYFYTEEGTLKAVDGVSFTVGKGETVCVVGESGCGKSVTALSILRLIPDPPGRIVSGSILFDGRDIMKLEEEDLRRLRGRRISMVFQEPMTALNPVFTIGDQITEAILVHEKMTRHQAEQRAVELLGLVGVPSPAERIRHYPHQLSGGLRQRVMIAMALACRPDLIIADEPTTALDVTIQAQILDLLAEIKNKTGMALLLITHNLGVVAEVGQRVIVMYAGRIVEEADVDALFSRPLHPYTRGLLASLPHISLNKEPLRRLTPIPGTVPALSALPGGCAFRNRCKEAHKECRSAEPKLLEVEKGHFVRCFLKADRP